MSKPLLSTLPYKGTRDFLPDEVATRKVVFGKAFRVVELFGFEKYDGPILESAEIYRAKSGEEIANRQLYLLTDKGGRELALRPEMTPSVARIIAGHIDSIQVPARWYSWINCHRYERPQKGRLREHWQLNADIFGCDTAEAEIEIFQLVHALMKALGAQPHMYKLRANDRSIVENVLKRQITQDAQLLHRLFKVIDAWEKSSNDERISRMSEIGLGATHMQTLENLLQLDFKAFAQLADEAIVRNSNLAHVLMNKDTANLVHFDPLIIRGFDYYTSTVFEVFDTSPENRRSIFGGGRYADLAGLFTDKSIAGIGFGMGDVTTWDFLDTWKLIPEVKAAAPVLVVATSEEFAASARAISNHLRDAGIAVARALDFQSLKKVFRDASRAGRRFVFVIGEDEYKSGKVTCKDMSTSEQWTLEPEECVRLILKRLQLEG